MKQNFSATIIIITSLKIKYPYMYIMHLDVNEIVVFWLCNVARILKLGPPQPLGGWTRVVASRTCFGIFECR